MKVNAIITEELQAAFNGASSSSEVGVRKKWDGDLAINIIQKVGEIQKSVGQAAFKQFNLPMLDDVFVQLLKRCGLDGKKNQCPTLHFFGDVANILQPPLGRGAIESFSVAKHWRGGLIIQVNVALDNYSMWRATVSAKRQ